MKQVLYSLKRIVPILLVYGMVASVLSACSAALSDTREGFYSSLGYGEMTYAPDFLTVSFERSFELFHYGQFLGRNTELATPERIDRYNEWVRMRRQQAKWERHKKRFYKKGAMFLEEFYANLGSTDMNAKYDNHLDSVLLPTLQKERGTTDWSLFTQKENRVTETRQPIVKPAHGHWFNVYMNGEDDSSRVVQIRLEDDKHYVINGLINPTRQIEMHALVREKMRWIAHFFNRLQTETDWRAFTRDYFIRCTKEVLQGIKTEDGVYNWRKMRLDIQLKEPITENDIEVLGHDEYSVGPKGDDAYRLRLYLKNYENDYFAIAGFINPCASRDIR